MVDQEPVSQCQFFSVCVSAGGDGGSGTSLRVSVFFCLFLQVGMMDQEAFSQCVYIGHGNLLTFDSSAFCFGQSGTFYLWKIGNREVLLYPMYSVNT